MDDERDYYQEAVAILSGASLMLPELGHLQALQEAMQEQREVGLIKIANDLELLKTRVLEMP